MTEERPKESAPTPDEETTETDSSPTPDEEPLTAVTTGDLPSDAAQATPPPASAASMSELQPGDHRSFVRPVVTYAAAGYLFLLVPGFVIGLLVAGDAKSLEPLRELLLLPVPIAGTIISYWFATRSADKRYDRGHENDNS